jgi:hypothetical protein
MGTAKMIGQSAGKRDQKRPVLPCVAARFAEVTLHQMVIASVGLEGDVERIAEDGDGADEDVPTHAAIALRITAQMASNQSAWASAPPDPLLALTARFKMILTAGSSPPAEFKLKSAEMSAILFIIYD